MNIKSILITFTILLSFASTANAKETCKSTKYTQVIDTVSFGMTIPQAKKALKKKYGSKATVINPKEGFLIVDFTRPQKNIERAIYLAQNGKITRQLYRYSESFMRKFGGPAQMFVAMVKKLQEKYGQHDDQKMIESEDKATFFWGNNGGATMQVSASSEGVDLRLDCEALEKEIQENASKSANFGF
jgi:hypothetical protein